MRFSLLVVIGLVALWSCNSVDGNKESEAEDTIVQAEDGSIFLSLKDAYVLQDVSNPKRNTAEWRFTVINKGRYEVWLTSHTKDTMNLEYEKPVIVHFGDKRLEAQPVGNEIVLDDAEVDKPYYRADSRIGSILIEDSGSYNLQFISEKVLKNVPGKKKSASTIIDKIFLIPQTH